MDPQVTGGKVSSLLMLLEGVGFDRHGYDTETRLGFDRHRLGFDNPIPQARI